MSEFDTSRTLVRAPFAGTERRFQLRLGEIAEVERLCGVGIGAIFMRLGSHQFGVQDVWAPIRLGLEGAGLSEPEATALVMRYQDGAPLMDYLPLAGAIVSAAVNGVPAGKPEAEGTKPADSPPDPATSRPSTASAGRSGGRRRKSTG